VSKFVNLNEFRKRKATGERAKQADENRCFHGRTKAVRAKDELQQGQLTAKVGGVLLDGKPEDK
jgi:hypothetical protein